MSNLNKETLQALSRLCRIELTDEELAALSHDLNRILNYIDLLREVDGAEITPYSHAVEQRIETLRPDEVGEHLPRELFLSNAPDQVGGMIRVPPIKQDL